MPLFGPVIAALTFVCLCINQRLLDEEKQRKADEKKNKEKEQKQKAEFLAEVVKYYAK